MGLTTASTTAHKASRPAIKIGVALGPSPLRQRRCVETDGEKTQPVDGTSARPIHHPARTKPEVPNWFSQSRNKPCRQTLAGQAAAHPGDEGAA
jgi:hypothetical protein